MCWISLDKKNYRDAELKFAALLKLMQTWHRPSVCGDVSSAVSLGSPPRLRHNLLQKGHCGREAMILAVCEDVSCAHRLAEKGPEMPSQSCLWQSWGSPVGLEGCEMLQAHASNVCQRCSLRCWGKLRQVSTSGHVCWTNNLPLCSGCIGQLDLPLLCLWISY